MLLQICLAEVEGGNTHDNERNEEKYGEVHDRLLDTAAGEIDLVPASESGRETRAAVLH